MRNILLLSYAFPPYNAPGAIRPAQLFRYLPELGFRPIVIASQVEGISNSEPHVHRVPAENVPVGVSVTSNIVRRVMRVAAPYNDHWPWVPYAASAASDLITSQGIEAVYSTSPFLASHFAALWLKLKFGLPWIADFQDPVRDNPFRARNWVYPYDLIIEWAIFRGADWILANTDTIAARWRQRYPQWADKISVSWNSFDPAEHFEVASRVQRPYRVLAHVGSLYGRRHPRKLLASIERLGITPSALRVKLIGPTDLEVVSAHESQFERLHRSGLLEFDNRLVPRVEALRATVDADYLLLLDVNENNTSFQVPSKLLDYIRSGRPILAYTCHNSPVERILTRSGIPHVTVDPATPDDHSDRRLLEFLQLEPGDYKASPWFTTNFSATALTSSTAKILSDLLCA
jgi:glycosyltransferase involved in cell wall biosynthesis